MIIRSQDKKMIINFNNIDSICIEHNVCEFTVVGFNGLEESRIKLGAYFIEEKAIKVLDMIQSAYLQECLCIQMPQESEV